MAYPKETVLKETLQDIISASDVMSDKVIEWFSGSKEEIINKIKDGVKSKLRKIYGINEDARVILSVAAINRHHKRVDSVVKAFSKLPNHLL